MEQVDWEREMEEAVVKKKPQHHGHCYGHHQVAQQAAEVPQTPLKVQCLLPHHILGPHLEEVG